MASGQQLPAIKVTYSYPGQLTCGTSVTTPESAIRDQTIIIANKYLDPYDAPYCNGGSVIYDFESIKATDSDKLRQEKTEILEYSY